VLNDAKENGFFTQLWDRTGLYSALGLKNFRALAGLNAIAAVAVEPPSDGAGRAPKSSRDLSHSELLIMEVGKSHTLLGLDLFVALEWRD
jgi:hypothetical protein